MVSEYQVMSPRAQWVTPDGLPTQAFYRCILGLFEIIGANKPGSLIPDNSIANVKLEQAPAQTLKGNPQGVLADEVDLLLGPGLAFVAGRLAGTAFRLTFVSAPQAIASAGGLALLHGLGAKPFGVAATLVCLVGEASYVAGQEVEIGFASVSVIREVADLLIRFSNAVSVFTLPDATTGAPTALTNANWNIVFRAWI